MVTQNLDNSLVGQTLLSEHLPAETLPRFSTTRLGCSIYPMCNNVSQDFKICGQFDLGGKKSFALDEVICYCSSVVDVDVYETCFYFRLQLRWW